VRKLGLPKHDELAMGAIASGGLRAVNDDVIRALQPYAEKMLEAVRPENRPAGAPRAEIPRRSPAA
jgi:predicted phosphoribosyltransferase